MRKTVPFLLLLCSLRLPAQMMLRPLASPASRYTGYSLHHSDLFSFTANPAALAAQSRPAAGLLAERPFLLPELNSLMLAATVSTNSGQFGLSAIYTGSADHSQTNAGLAYGRSLGSKVSVGARFGMQQIRFSSGYGQATAVTSEAGLIIHLTDQLHTGFRVANPVAARFGPGKSEKLPAVYTFGAGYEASAQLLVAFTVEKEEYRPVNVTAGISYLPVPVLLIRAGLSSATSSWFTETALVIKSTRISVLASYHPQLGVTPGLSFIFHFNKKES